MHLYHHHFLDRDSLQLWFSPWRTLVSSSVEILVLPVPHGPKMFLTLRRWGAPRPPRAEPPWSHGRTTATCGPEQLGALIQSAQREPSRGERHPVARRGAAEPLPRLTATCDLSCHAGAHLDWDAVTLSGEERAPPSSPSKPSRPCQTVWDSAEGKTRTGERKNHLGKICEICAF